MSDEELAGTDDDGGDDTFLDGSTDDVANDGTDVDMDQEQLLEAMLGTEQLSKPTTEDDGTVSEDEKAPEEPVITAPKTKREERAVVQLQKVSEENQTLKLRVRELETKPQVRGIEPSGDIVGDILDLVAQTHGIKADDPRINDILRNEVGGGILAHLAGSQTKDPELRRIQDLREQRRSTLSVQREIQAMKAQTQTEYKSVQAQRNELEGRQFVAQTLTKHDLANDYPYLSAVSDDIQEDVYEALGAMSQNGWVPTGQQDIEDGIEYALKTIEKDRRATADRLKKVGNGQNSAGQPKLLPEKTRGSQKDGTSERNRGEDRAGKVAKRGTLTASGPGNRTAPKPAPQDPDDLLETMLQEELAERRRNAARRPGR